MEKYAELLIEAKKHFRIADHMAYVTLSLLKDNRLIIKILSELEKSVSYLIKSILYYEVSLKRIRVYSDPTRNLNIFINTLAPRFLKQEDLKNIISILELQKKHRDAPVEFVRREKFVILLGDKYVTLDIKRVRELIHSTRTAISSFKFE